jgi:3D-(3,5/4)-trihydroxycyclohexane-1,2-dione acylhydrolase (decyclizing)
VIECAGYADFAAALRAARDIEQTTVIYVQNDRLHGVPGYDSWWDVPVAEVSDMPAVSTARREWETMRARERPVF